MNYQSFRKKYSIWVLVLVSIFISLFIFPGCTKTHYIASGHPEWAPIMYRDGDLIVGAGADLIKMIAADLEFPIKVKSVGTWDRVQALAKNGEVDILVAAYKTPEREVYMDYSNAYTTDPIALYVQKGKKLNYSAWGDLIGKNGVLTIGDSYGKEFDSYIKDKLDTVRVKTSKEAFDAVMNGQADYFVYALYSGEKFLAENGLSEKIEIIPNPVASENFYITISKKSSLINRLPEINTALEKYKKDGTIDNLISKHRASYLKNK